MTTEQFILHLCQCASSRKRVDLWHSEYLMQGLKEKNIFIKDRWRIKTQQYQLYLISHPNLSILNKRFVFSVVSPRTWRRWGLASNISISNGTCPPGAKSVSKHLLGRCHEGNNLLVSKVGEILHCHSIWCLRIFCFGEFQSLLILKALSRSFRQAFARGVLAYAQHKNINVF